MSQRTLENLSPSTQTLKANRLRMFLSALGVIIGIGALLAILMLALKGGLRCVAGIPLVVGGVGIMNVLLASVTERTREIGLRRAAGALWGGLMVQFLSESVAISRLGGLWAWLGPGSSRCWAWP